MEIVIAVAKVRKFASSKSGDTVEVVERPHGGVSVVLADGQSSGRGAKSISTLVVRKVISLLAEGVRDGAAARAASDSLFTEKNGKVSSTLNIVSADFHSNTLVLTRNNPIPAILIRGEVIEFLDSPSSPIGLHRATRPVITELPIQEDLTAVVFSDGLTYAGDRAGKTMDLPALLRQCLSNPATSPQAVVDIMLEEALRLDDFRPADDISIVVLRVMPGTTLPGKVLGIRRMSLNLPTDS